MSDDVSNVYLNTVISLNAGWDALLTAYMEFDLLVHYIRYFERILSVNLPYMLENNDNYKLVNEKFPLPEDDTTSMTPEAFRAWIAAFEGVMRDYGIIGRKAGGKGDVADPIAVFFGGAET